MNSVPAFVVIDDIDENRFLLTKTLLRKFPGSFIVECQDSSGAFNAIAAHRPAVIIVHRSSDLDGLSLIRELRRRDAATPIIMVSGRDTYPEALSAGAEVFLNYDAWLRIGTVAEEILTSKSAKPVTQSPFLSATAGAMESNGLPR
jgi:DNA-binding NtrC family response regulator